MPQNKSLELAYCFGAHSMNVHFCIFLEELDIISSWSKFQKAFEIF